MRSSRGALAACILPALLALPSVAAPAASPAPACVFVLHGLARGADSMATLCARLADAGFAVTNVAYPSTTGTLDDMTVPLAAAVGAQACAEAHFVGYSLGGLVIRHYLAREAPARLGRVVLIASPNGGTEIVDAIGGTCLFRAVMGELATELGTADDALPRRLPAPHYPVGVIAGDRSINLLGSLLIPGRHDGTVSVASTRLDGMTDFLLVHRTHTFIMNGRDVAAQTIGFLRTGRFRHPDAAPAG